MANISVGNVTVDPDEELLHTPHTSSLLTAFLILVCLTTILANLSVITSFVLEPRLREPFNYFLLNLACSDLITGLFGMTHLIVYTYYRYWPLGYKHCTFWLYTDWLGVNESILTMAVISLDRLWAAAVPLSYRRFNTTRKAVVVIIISWLVVHAGILPGQVYDRLYHTAHYGKFDCYWDFNGPTVWAGPLYVVPVTEFVPALVIIICYIGTSFKLYQRFYHRSQQITGAHPGEQNLSRIRAKERRLLKERQSFLLLSLLSVGLIVCWGPWFVYSSLSTYEGYSEWLTYMVTYWIGYGMSTLNPFLFNIANPDMRQTVKRVISCGKVRRTPTLAPASSNREAQVSSKQ